MRKSILTAIICLLVSSCSTCSRTFKNESILDYYGQCIDNLDTDVNRNMFDVSRDLVKEVEEDRRLCKSDRDMVIGWIFERLENLNEPWEPLYLHVGRLIRKKTPVSCPNIPSMPQQADKNTGVLRPAEARISFQG